MKMYFCPWLLEKYASSTLSLFPNRFLSFFIWFSSFIPGLNAAFFWVFILGTSVLTICISWVMTFKCLHLLTFVVVVVCFNICPGLRAFTLVIIDCKDSFFFLLETILQNHFSMQHLERCKYRKCIDWKW